MITNKVCNQCNQLLEINMFHRKSKSKDGYDNKCKKCSKMNKDARPKENVTLTCEVCGKKFERYKVDAKKSKKQYCSRSCYDKALIEYNSNKKTGEMHPCTICGKEVYATGWYKNSRNHIYCSYECRDKGISKYFSGPNHPQWRGEMTYQERVKSRLLEGYKSWRLSVYKRDKYTCKCCGYDKGNTLVAHHKNGWDKFPEQRFDVQNGVTLCKSCHKEFHSIYGYGGNTETQFEEWISSSLIDEKRKKLEVVAIGEKNKPSNSKPIEKVDTKSKLDESRILAQKKALKLFKERKVNGLTVNEIAEQTGLSRAWIYILARKENVAN